MTPPFTNQEIARAYATGARALFGSATRAIPERAALRPSTIAQESQGAAREATSETTLLDRAAALAPLSAELTRTASAGLAAADPAERAQAATQLLAKALADLQISAYLLQAAPDAAPMTRAVERGVDEATVFAPGDIEESLALLLGEAPATLRSARAVAMPADLPAAREQLAALVTATLNLIETRAAKTGQTAMSGLLALGLGHVAQAAGIVGLDIAQALGVGEKVTRLVTLVREFALSAYNAVVALCGPAIAQTASQQVLAWLNDVAAGQRFAKLLEQLYETQGTGAQLGKLAAESQADLGKFAVALQGVDGLRTSFGEQLALVDRLLQGFRLFGGAAASAIPQATVLMAAAYLIITGYAVLAGADYVDAARLKILNRVPGVRQVVETSLVVE
jgi:hypothetical protein